MMMVLTPDDAFYDNDGDHDNINNNSISIRTEICVN